MKTTLLIMRQFQKPHSEDYIVTEQTDQMPLVHLKIMMWALIADHLTRHGNSQKLFRLSEGIDFEGKPCVVLVLVYRCCCR